MSAGIEGAEGRLRRVAGEGVAHGRGDAWIALGGEVTLEALEGARAREPVGRGAPPQGVVARELALERSDAALAPLGAQRQPQLVRHRAAGAAALVREV